MGIHPLRWDASTGQGFLRRNRDALTQALRGRLLRQFRNRPDIVVDDVADEAMASLEVRLGRFVTWRDAWGYALATAFNLFRKAVAREARQIGLQGLRRIPFEELDAEDSRPLNVHNPDPRDQVDFDDLLSTLVGPERSLERDIVDLLYLDGATRREICARWNISLSTLDRKTDALCARIQTVLRAIETGQCPCRLQRRDTDRGSPPPDGTAS